MRQIRPGVVISVAGTCQPNPRDLGVDLVVHELRVVAPKGVDALISPDLPLVSPATTPASSSPSPPAPPPPPSPLPSPPSPPPSAEPVGDVPLPPVGVIDASGRTTSEPAATYLVGDAAGLTNLEAALDEAIRRNQPVAFDCEWRPRGLEIGTEVELPAERGASADEDAAERQTERPLALLQLSTVSACACACACACYMCMCVCV